MVLSSPSVSVARGFCGIVTGDTRPRVIPFRPQRSTTWTSKMQNVIQAQLASGEKLPWEGRPMQGIVCRCLHDSFQSALGRIRVLFGILCAFDGQNSIVLRALGNSFRSGWTLLHRRPLFVDAKQRANTFYGVTNQRVIIVSGMLNSKVNSLNLRTLSDLTLAIAR
jgi:hypothetical protein